MLPKIFTSITRNTRALETELLLLNNQNMQNEVESVYARLRLFKTLRTSVVIYLGKKNFLEISRIFPIFLFFIFLFFSIFFLFSYIFL